MILTGSRNGSESWHSSNVLTRDLQRSFHALVLQVRLLLLLLDEPSPDPLLVPGADRENSFSCCSSLYSGPEI